MPALGLAGCHQRETAELRLKLQVRWVDQTQYPMIVVASLSAVPQSCRTPLPLKTGKLEVLHLFRCSHTHTHHAHAHAQTHLPDTHFANPSHGSLDFYTSVDHFKTIISLYNGFQSAAVFVPLIMHVPLRPPGSAVMHCTGHNPDKHKIQFVGFCALFFPTHKKYIHC